MLDRVPVLSDSPAFEPLDRMDHFLLDVRRKPRRYSVGIIFIRVEPLGLQKNLMTGFAAEFFQLIFNGRTVTHARRLDLPRIHRREMHILLDNLMGPLVRAGDIAG